MTVLIYRAACITSGKVYFGLTTRSLAERWSRHIHKAIKTNSRYAIHCAIRKYGITAFDLAVVYEAVDLREAMAVERGLICTHRSVVPFGYNMTTGGEGTQGIRPALSAATRKKIGDFHRGRERPPETGRKISIALKGRKLSQQSKDKISKAKRGVPRPASAGGKTAAALRGRRRPENVVKLLQGPKSTGRPNSHGCKGVKQRGARWEARITIDGRQTYLGSFITKEQAHAAYAKASAARLQELLSA